MGKDCVLGYKKIVFFFFIYSAKFVITAYINHFLDMYNLILKIFFKNFNQFSNSEKYTKTSLKLQ